MTEKTKQCSVAIVGGGMVGLFLAKALSHANIKVAVVESTAPPFDVSGKSLDSRVSAVNVLSVRMLNNLDVWSSLKTSTYSPLRALKVWDSVGGAEIEFDSADVGEPALGAIVENREVVRALSQSLQDNACVEWFCPAEPKAMEQTDRGSVLILNDGTKIQSDLIVGADGAQSWVREQMRVDRHERPYRQSAVVAVIQTEKPHQKTGWQAFLSEGVLALLPLADLHHCAMVWSTETTRADELVAMDSEYFNRTMNNEFGRRLGDLKNLNAPKAIPLVMRHVKQYVKPGVALIGDAAHTIHPLAGQGVNLGFMDAACLAQCIIDAQTQHRAIGSLRVLRRYERWRKGDNTAMLVVMRGFKELFGTMSPWVIQARSVGMNTTNQLSCLKNALMRMAMGEARLICNKYVTR